jgi:hypothetical protein
MTSIPALPDLVGDVVLAGLAGPRDPIRQIGEAERLAGELIHLGESLIGFFVEQARADGLSWADIGAPHGLSRQGAQQRYAPFLAYLTVADLVEAGALQQFGEAASAAVRRAEGHAARLGRDSIDSGDLLLGVLDDDGSAALAAIRELRIDPGVLRAELDRPEGAGSAGADPEGTGSSASGGRAVVSSPPLGPEARRAIDGAISEARGHLVGPSHLLLGMLRNPGSRAGRVLAAHDVTKSTAMGAIIAVGGRQSPDRR